MPQNRITNDWVLDRFDTLYPAHRVAFARLLVTLRRDFGGDLDAMLVLLTLSLGTDRKGWAESLFAKLETVPQTRLTNTQSVALFSGIPRETVRRKLESMQARGWVVRDAAGNWSPTARASEDLRASSQETLNYIRAIAVAAMSADADPSRSARRPDGSAGRGDDSR